VLARGLAQAGAKVVLNGRVQESLDQAAAMLRGEGLEASSALFNVLDRDKIEAEVRSIEGDAGPIDILGTMREFNGVLPPPTSRG